MRPDEREIIGGPAKWAGGNEVGALSLAHAMCEASLFSDKQRVEGG